MVILDIFCGSQTLASTLRADGHNVVTVDIKQCHNTAKLTHKVDILNFDYTVYPPDYFDFAFIGLPCTTFSKAAAYFHFYKNLIPRTPQAHTSILILGKIYELLKYFNFPPFILENPQGGLRNNFFFKNHCYFSTLLTYSTSLGVFGFPTQKKTDLFTNFDHLILFPTSYRVNGRYQKKNLDNMTTKQKSSYPKSFCSFISDNIKPLREKKPPAGGVLISSKTKL